MNDEKKIQDAFDSIVVDDFTKQRIYSNIQQKIAKRSNRFSLSALTRSALGPVLATVLLFAFCLPLFMNNKSFNDAVPSESNNMAVGSDLSEDMLSECDYQSYLFSQDMSSDIYYLTPSEDSDGVASIEFSDNDYIYKLTARTSVGANSVRDWNDMIEDGQVELTATYYNTTGSESGLYVTVPKNADTTLDGEISENFSDYFYFETIVIELPERNKIIWNYKDIRYTLISDESESLNILKRKAREIQFRQLHAASES